MKFDRASVRDADVAGKRVLVRTDFNVPIEDGRITDDSRISSALPTIRLLLERKARVILCSHLGRPDGQAQPEFSLAPVSNRLAEMLGRPVVQAGDVAGPSAHEVAAALKDGQLAMLENTRFEPGETSNDPQLAAALAELADLYVNDAFGVAHRAHASTSGVAGLLPSYAGLLLQNEIESLQSVVEHPDRPLVVVLGGAKVSDKVGVIARFLEIANRILIGGAMCFPFLKAQGHPIGNSLCADTDVPLAEEALAAAANGGCALELPVDLVLGREFSDTTEVKDLDGLEVPDGWMGLDIGPKSARGYAKRVAGAATVLWNGPMGAFELEPFSRGTRRVAEAVADSSARTVVGGGDSVAALKKFGLTDQVDWVSTGGGASLELLEGQGLPGVTALDKA